MDSTNGNVLKGLECTGMKQNGKIQNDTPVNQNVPDSGQLKMTWMYFIIPVSF